MDLRRRLAYALAEFAFWCLGTRRPGDWHARELRAVRLLHQDLHEYLALAERAREMIRDTIVHVGHGGHGSAGEVQVRLLNRLATELRAVELCSLYGYQLQAMSLAANLVEHAHVLGYIGRSEQRAQEWLQHEKFERSYPGSVRKAIRGSLEEQGRPPTDLAVEWTAYGSLCIAKHGNPQALRNYGVEQDESRLILHFGPFVSVATPGQARFALYQGIRAVAMGVYAAEAPRYGSESVIPVLAVQLLKTLNRIQERDLPWITRDIESDRLANESPRRRPHG